jgi:hypothetical protein
MWSLVIRSAATWLIESVPPIIPSLLAIFLWQAIGKWRHHAKGS